MTIKDSIKVKNYKCFDSSGEGFERIMPINVIIGKNNSGKSSLIDLIDFLIHPTEDFINTGRDNKKAEVIITHLLTENDIAQVFRKGYAGGSIQGDHLKFGLGFVGKMYTYRFIPNGKQEYINIGIEFEKTIQDKIEELANRIDVPLQNKIFCNITAERDISPEKEEMSFILNANGIGATNYIQEIVNKTKYKSSLIELALLKEFNKIINPDIQITRIVPQKKDNDQWEIFFEDSQNNRIALSKMGSGIKTVLLVLLNLIVRPEIEKNDPKKYVFAFEELENNLHPSLQRRLYTYLKHFSEKHGIYFFLTTHSNVVIDSFGTYKNAQLIHITNNTSNSRTKTVLSFQDNKKILKDLDVKASDLLQSNSIIWVEGPSDRNYVIRWLEILAPDLIEGHHFSIMFYGGRLLANLTFDYDWFNKEIIPLLKINANAFVIIDRDGKHINAKLNQTKLRICKEIGEENCWVTKGREIENYLSENAITEWLKDKHGITANFSNEIDTKLEDNILNSGAKIKIKYNFNKLGYSSEISEYIDKKSLDKLDLKNKISVLINKIREWNSL